MKRYEDYNPNIDETASGSDSREDPLTYSDDRPSGDGAGPDSISGKSGSGQRRKKKPSGRKKTSARGSSGSTTSSVADSFSKVKRFLQSTQVRFMVGITCLLLCAYLLVAFISYIKDGMIDQSAVENLPNGAAQVRNMAGEGGARLSEFLINQTFGLGSAVIIIWLAWMAMKQFGLMRFKAVNFTIKCLVALITVSLIVGLMTVAVDSHFHWGGNHGYYINQAIIGYFGWIGASLLCIFMLSLFFVICLNDIVQFFLRKRRIRRARRAAELEALEAEEERLRKIAEMQSLEEDARTAEAETENALADENGMVFDGGELPAGGTDDRVYGGNDDMSAYDETSDDFQDDQDGDGAVKDEDDAPELKDFENAGETDADTGEDNVDEMQVNVNDISIGVDADEHPDIYDPTAELSNYKFPPYNLLREEESKISIDEQEQLENKERIRATLLDFDIAITSITATVGPTVTLYEIRLEKGIKIARIRNLGDDIALSLAAKGVRIIAPIPGKGTVGIEVANKDPQTVSMRTIVTSRKYQECRYDLPIAIGSTINNQVYIADLTKMPHLLVAGATGQGKSVGLNAIIASLLYRKHPAELKFVLVDPKMVEFSLYKDLERHYLAKLPGEDDAIITNPDKVVATLSSLCVEMDDRYALLQMAQVRNIKEYNEKFVARRLNPEKGHRFMPYIVVVVDEFSDLIMTAGKDVEIPIARLAQKARAIGIHVIIATQRPSTNVITGIIKANFPARIAFKVASGVDSKTILDTSGAQQLIGRGDMLISTSSEMERVQCAFIDTPEVSKICDFIKHQPGYSDSYILPEPIITGGDGEGGRADSNNFGEKDALFDEIARLVVNSNTASTSSLQRRYSIGYNRAGKIMDQLEAAGIVGPSQGGKPRNVLVDPITLESILNS